ncbi:MAG: hypothetical protein ACD_27C00042G0001 [uncultured bacterium]|nr:MAG: hypothetical protein ACD_27C00042G0001 [uncultured bacterium]
MIGVGDKVGGNITFVKSHPIFVLNFDLKAFAFFDFDDTVFANEIEGFGNFLADFSGLGTNGSDFDPIRFFDIGFHFFEFGNNGGDSLVDTLFHEHGVGTGCDIFHTSGNELLSQKGGGSSTITGGIIGFAGRFFD